MREDRASDDDRLVRVDPSESALGVAQRLGLNVDRARTVGTGTHALVRLDPEPVAARVTVDGIFARFAGDLEAEVRLADELHAAGAPVVSPLPGVPPRVHESGGRRVTLWTWWQEAGDDERPEAAGRALARCHRGMAKGVRVSLRPWAKLAGARALLAQLPHRHRASLAPHLQPPLAPLRPVHGDAHAGNVLAGPVWHDWEDAQLACVEWDLACLVAPGRVLGMDFGHAETVLAGYDAPYDSDLLDRCVAARTAQQTVYGLLLGDALPGLPDRVRVRLDWLAERRP